MKALTVLSALFLIGSFAQASGGGMEGGGGVGVRCGTKLELLDLHEAKLRKQTLIQMPSSAKDTIELLSNKMARHFQWFTWENPETWSELYQVALVQPIYEGREFLYTFKNLTSGEFEEVLAPVSYVTHLPLSTDIGTYQIQPGCHLEQIAYMTDGDRPKLEIVEKRWDELDELSRAALIAHETLYFFQRFNSLESLLKLSSSKTSEASRRFVGELLSTQPPPPISTDVPDNTVLTYCGAAIDHEDDPYTHFVVRENSSGFKAVFEDLEGTNDLYQILATFTGTSFAKFGALSGEGTLQSRIVLNGSSSPTHLHVELNKVKNNEAFQFKLFKTIAGKTEQVGATRDIYCGTVE